MKIIGFLVLSVASLTTLAGCTTAGPFVTNISSDGNGGLVVEKAMVQMNGFTGTVTNVNPSTSTIYIYPPDKKSSNAQNSNQ
jgi:hypothetical protein